MPVSNSGDQARLLHIRDAIIEIETYVEGFNFDRFSNDSKTFNATVRQLEIIGEASNHLSESLKTDNLDIPWRNITGIRNFLIHQYFGVDPKVVWEVVQVDLKPLKIRVIELAKD